MKKGLPVKRPLSIWMRTHFIYRITLGPSGLPTMPTMPLWAGTRCVDKREVAIKVGEAGVERKGSQSSQSSWSSRWGPES